MSSHEHPSPERVDSGEDATDSFEPLRPHLMGVAYRILGSMVDAEDVLQNAWLRWSKVDHDEVRDPKAFLTTMVGRLSIDHLRRVKALRETYTGSWLPEPISHEPDPAEDPGVALELADSLSMALLVVLENLSPAERAAFVLREVFERPYAEVAAALGRSEVAVRQLVRRGRERVDAGHARYQADRRIHAEVVQQFLEACQGGDVTGLMGMLAPDVVIISDAGGHGQAPARPVRGRDKVARLLAGASRKVAADVVFSIEYINGSPGIVARAGKTPISVMTLTIAEGLVQTLHLVANPEKLAFVQSPEPGLI